MCPLLCHVASQMWCLGRVLPFLIGEFIPEGDHHWHNFITLLTIMDFVFAPTTTADKADLVAALIQDFLADFKQLYPDRNLIPKMHYMTHMPSWMKWYINNLHSNVHVAVRI